MTGRKLFGRDTESLLRLMSFAKVGASVTSTDASIGTWNRIDPRSAPGG